MKSGTVDELCHVEYGTRVVRKRDGGSIYPVYGGGDVTFAMDTFNRSGRVIIARFGMSEKCTRFVADRFFLNDSGLTISPRKPYELLPAYLDMWAVAMNDAIYALGKGVAQRNLDVPAFRSMKISYPADVIEQQRIVQVLDEAFAGIDTVAQLSEKKLAALGELRNALLHQAFNGRL